MPLLTGDWNLNVNGSVGILHIANVSADGSVTGSAFNVPFTGLWHESGQSLFFATMVWQGGGRGSDRAQFNGYLFRTPIMEVPGQDIRWTLCGYLQAPPGGLSMVVPHARRTTFGWFAYIDQVV